MSRVHAVEVCPNVAALVPLAGLEAFARAVLSDDKGVPDADQVAWSRSIRLSARHDGGIRVATWLGCVSIVVALAAPALGAPKIVAKARSQKVQCVA
jgi:hypothetical protein